MKRLGCLLVSFCLVLGILLIAVADVNHGHGPGYVAEEEHGESNGHDAPADSHGESTDGHGEAAGGHDTPADDHGESVDSHAEPTDAHAITSEQVH